MAKIDFNSYNNYQRPEGGNSNLPRVTFFSLVNDGDEVIVRFPYSTPEEFELDAVHTASVPTQNGKRAFKKVSCLRTAREALELCPFCAKGGETLSKVSLRFFCRIVRYVKDETTGAIKAEACVWDRPAALSKTLKGYMDDYGDLHNVLFKIKRHGVKGDQNTTYDIQVANPAVYKPEMYPADFSGFNNFDMSQFFCLKKDAFEMEAYLQTGSFPVKSAPVAQAAPQQAPHYQTFTPQTEIASDPMPFPQQAVYTLPNQTSTPPAQTVVTTAVGDPTHAPTQAAPQYQEAPRPRRYAV